jgi:hypothetical protein
MKTVFSIAALAVLLTSTSPCFALGSVLQLSKEDAQKLGMEVRSKAAGPNQVRVELEFKVEGGLKNFRHVDLWIGEGGSPLLAAPLHEDRSKPGQVAVSFTADRAHLDKITLRVTISELGNTVYILRIKDFVEPEKATADGPPPTPAPQAPPDRLADMLILLDKQLWQATSSYDVETIGKILADDWDCQKPKWTKADHLEMYKQHRYDEVNIVGERRVYRIDKHTALMSYESKWHAVSKGQEPRESHGHTRTIHCWVERDGGWVIKHTEYVDLLGVEQPAPAPAIENGKR